ncbi:MAG: alkylmercury lyase family protein [Bacteroidota bacterium]
MISNSTLHHTILREIIEKGYAPDVNCLSEILGEKREDVTKALYALQDYHGVVLHPHEPEVWVIHPFSLAPTNFYVKTKDKSWWGNCAWCSLGVAALVKEDVSITTTLGAQTKQVEINIVNGKVLEEDYIIHFPIPMKKAWDNVIYTCTNMLIFENEKQIDKWSAQHNIPKGDVQPIKRIWEFSKKWYGNHLDPNWTKWTIPQAKEMFEEFDLNHKIWHLEDSKERF